MNFSLGIQSRVQLWPLNKDWPKLFDISYRRLNFSGCFCFCPIFILFQFFSETRGSTWSNVNSFESPKPQILQTGRIIAWNYPRAALTQQCLLFTESGSVAHMIMTFLSALKLRPFEILASYNRVVWASRMRPGG